MNHTHGSAPTSKVIYVVGYKYVYLSLILLNPLAIFIRHFYLNGPGYGSRYIMLEFPLHVFIFVLNVAAWIIYRKRGAFGVFYERLLSIGRMMMILFGASVGFGFINMESPVYDIIWYPLMKLINWHGANGIVLYLFCCGMLMCAEVNYCVKLDGRQAPEGVLVVIIYICMCLIGLFSVAIGWRDVSGWFWLINIVISLYYIFFSIYMFCSSNQDKESDSR